MGWDGMGWDGTGHGRAAHHRAYSKEGLCESGRTRTYGNSSRGIGVVAVNLKP